MKHVKLIICCLSFTLLTSCYTVRFMVSNGVPETEDSDSEDPLAGQQWREKKMVVNRKILNGNEFFTIKDCDSGSLHTIEYKTTFGGILLYIITFGTNKEVKIRYVCTKEGSTDFDDF